jgi:hypothetical protein
MRDILLTNLFSTRGVIFPVTKKATHMVDPLTLETPHPQLPRTH